MIVTLKLIIMTMIVFQIYLVLRVDMLAHKYDRSRRFWVLFTLFFGMFAAILFLLQTADEQPITDKA